MNRQDGAVVYDSDNGRVVIMLPPLQVWAMPPEIADALGDELKAAAAKAAETITKTL